MNATEPRETATSTPAGQPLFDSVQLFRGSTEILIAHDGAIYRMKITRQGKLILTK